MKKILTVLLALAAACLAGVTRHVPSEYGTIQLAIDACNNGDAVLVSPGVYMENINFGGRNITVTSDYSTDHDPQTVLNTVIQGTGTGSVVTIAGGEDSTAVLAGFSIRGGNYTMGGGISVRNASPTLANLCIYDNSGTFGAGLFLQNSSSEVSRLTICHNSGCGLRIMAGCPIAVSSCIIFYNTSGVYNASQDATVTFCDVQGWMEGTGNTGQIPLFSDAENHDYRLQADSPCVNRGSPFIGPDWDGTRPDMGALLLQNDEEDIYVDFTATQVDYFADPAAPVAFSSTLVPFNCSVQTYCWTFGDGEILPEDPAPTHTYTHGGHFGVGLTAISDSYQQYDCYKQDYLTIYTSILETSISGTLIASHSPYFVGQWACVESNTQLTLEPGVELFFNTDTGMAVYGQITAAGTEEDSIFICSYNETPGSALYINSPAVNLFQHCHFSGLTEISAASPDSGQVCFEHCLVEDNTLNGIKFNGGIGILRHSVVRDCGIMDENSSGLFIASPQVLVEDNLVYGNRPCQVQIRCSDGLTTVLRNNLFDNEQLTTSVIALLGQNSSATIIGNEIRRGSLGLGFDNDTYAYVLNNEIHGNYAGLLLYYTNAVHPCRIQGNLIRNNQLEGIHIEGSPALIANNTIVNNNASHSAAEAGIWFTLDSALQVVNNIIYGNTNDFYREFGYSLPAASYNLTESALTNIVLDQGNNLAGDPGFLSATDFRLSSDSPCVDTGNPDPLYYALLDYDPAGFPRLFDGNLDGTAVIDRGCYEFNPAQGIEDNNLPGPGLLEISLYPNPFRSSINISIRSKEQAKSEISIYNLKGQLVRKIIPGLGKSAVWNGLDSSNRPVAAGVYLIKAKQADRQTVKKIVRLQ